MNMKKRLISLLLALGLAISLAVPAVAAEGKLIEMGDDYRVKSVIPELHWAVLRGEWSADKVIDLDTGLQVENYESAEYCGKFVIVKARERYGLLKPDGTPLTGVIYSRIKSFGTDHVEVWDDDYKPALLDWQGRVVVPFKYDGISWMHEGFAEGLVPVVLNEKVGFINEQGVEVIPPQYDSTGYFSEGLAPVAKCDASGWYKWGVIDKTGKLVVPMKYEGIHDYNGGLAAVLMNDKWGLLDTNGKLVVPTKYLLAAGVGNGLAVVIPNSYSMFYVDKTGKVIVSNASAEDDSTLQGGGKWIVKGNPGSEYYDSAIYDLQGKCLIPHGNYSQFLFDEENGLVKGWRYPEASPCVLMDWNLKVITKPYAEIGEFHEGLAAVARVDEDTGEEWHGFIDLTGKEVIPTIYSDAGNFSCGLAYVAVTDADGTKQYGYINARGEMIISPRYSVARDFSDGIALVCEGEYKRGRRYIYITTEGKEVFSLPERSGVYNWDFENGLAATGLGLINRAGEILLTGSKFRNLTVQNEPTAYWEVDKSSIYINPYFNADSLNTFTASKTYAGQFGDVPAKVWYAEAVRICYEYGLMNGSGGKFDPSGRLTVAQAITMASRVHEIYHTGERNLKNGKPWYQTYVDYALANGIVKEGDFTPADYTRNITRAEMAGLFAHAVDAVDLYQVNKVSAVSDVTAATPYADEILTLYRAGVLTGAGGGMFYPSNDISRSEAAAILARIILPEQRKSVSF